MAKYVIDGATLTAIADKMRELTPYNRTIEDKTIKPEEIPQMLPFIRQDGYDEGYSNAYDEGYSDGMATASTQQVQITFTDDRFDGQSCDIYYIENGVQKVAYFQEDVDAGEWPPLTLSIDKGSLFYVRDPWVSDPFGAGEMWLDNITPGVFATVLQGREGSPLLCQALKSGIISVNYA